MTIKTDAMFPARIYQNIKQKKREVRSHTHRDTDTDTSPDPIIELNGCIKFAPGPKPDRI